MKRKSMAEDGEEEEAAAIPEMSERRRSRKELRTAFNNYCQRRSAIIKALTTDLYEFLRQCCAEEEVCLYGQPDGKWEVVAPPWPPVAEVEFSGVPQPAGGINWARKNLSFNEWLYYVASQSDIWLISLALYPFQIRSIKNRLFQMINSLPSVAEIVSLIFNFKPIPAALLSPPSSPSADSPTVDDAFRLYSGHRAAFLKALTTDVNSFLRQCNPVFDIYLYGHWDGNWEVSDESKQTTMMFGNPVTTTGIKLRPIDAIIAQNQWYFVFLTGLKCDLWLYDMAFHSSLFTQYFSESQRKEFHEKINELQLVMGSLRRQ